MNTEDVTDLLGRLQTVALMAQTVTNAELVDLVNECEHTDALAPILEPTWYRAAWGGVDQIRRVADATLTFRRALTAAGVQFVPVPRG